MKRPLLNKETSIDDFEGFYWLRAELISFCRSHGLSSSGGKVELAQRISQFISTGQKLKPDKTKNKKQEFDWHKDELTLNTLITDYYRNTQNVRKFFLNQIGPHFRFNTIFMEWIRNNSGKNLRNAIDEWFRIETMKKDPGFKTEIAPQFQYNAYMRAFLEDNPGKTSQDAIHFWKLKRKLKGPKVYDRSDLLLI